MAQLEHLVEVKLLPHGISLYGTLTGTAEQSISVRLLTLPRLSELVRQGTEVEVVSSADGSIHAAAACVSGMIGDELVLALQQAPSEVQRRSAPRIALEVPVQYRAVRTDGRTGAWLDAMTYDLSSGGLGLMLDQRAEIPKRLEVIFYLPGEQANVKGSSRLYSDDGSVILNGGDEERRIRVVARTAHCRAHSDGRLKVGVSFTMIASEDRVRVERFTRAFAQQAAA